MRDDAVMAGLVSAWFVANARELPWRVGLGIDRCAAAASGLGKAGSGGRTAAERRGTRRRDPYVALVSEAMLQQTQVSRVVEKFVEFVGRFPTVHSLSAADEGEVLGLWTGLGYYRRARNLHAAARMVVTELGGEMPRGVEELQRLPGVGRYTAGAIASIAHGERAAIVDGNVARVLLRVHGKDTASDDRDVQGWLWERAGALVRAAESPGLFNEGLMELGATVCVPGVPLCERCPLGAMCVARRGGRQAEIPRPKKRTARKTVWCGAAVVERADGAVLLERRGEGGMWAGMWQAPTIERTDRAPTAAEVARTVGVRVRDLTGAEPFEFLATHRRMVFEVFRARVGPGWSAGRGEFVGREEAARLGMSRPQRRALLIGESGSAAGVASGAGGGGRLGA